MKIFQSTALFLAVCATAAALCACGPQRRDKLSERIKDFSGTLRWQNLDLAKTFMYPELIAKVAPVFEYGGRTIEVINFEIRDIYFGEDDKEAVARLVFQWRVIPDVTIREDMQVQTWKYEDGLWRLTKLEGRLMDDYTAASDRAKKSSAQAASPTGQSVPDTREIPKTYERKPDI